MKILDNLKSIFTSKKQTASIEKKKTPTGYETDQVGGFDIQSSKNSELLEQLFGWTGACVSAISDQIGAIQIKLFKQEKDGVTEIKEHEILDLLFKVNEFTSKFDHFWLTQTYLELAGEAPWFLEKQNGKITNIYFLRPDKFEPIPDKEKIVRGYIYKPDVNTKIKLEPDEVIFLKFPNPANPFRGRGTLEQAARIVDIDNFSEEWNKNFFKNSARPDTVLTIKNLDQMDEQQKLRLKRSLEKTYQGLDKSHKTMVLWGDMVIDKLSLGPKEMDFTEQLKMSRDKILGIFRVPKAIIAQTDGVNLANAKTAQFVFAKYTIVPKMERLVQQLNEFLLPQFSGTENMFLDFVTPVPEDEELKLKQKESGIKTGYLTINEVRAESGLPDVEGGDVIYLPMNLAPIGSPQEVKELKVLGKKDIKINQDRIREMRARNPEYFNSEDIKKQIKDNIKQEVKSKLKKELKKIKNITEEWSSDKKVNFWEAKNKVFQKYRIEVHKTMDKIFEQQRVKTLKKLKNEFDKNKGLNINAVIKKIDTGNIALNKKEEIKLTANLTLPIFEELYESSANETLGFMGMEQNFNVKRADIQKQLKTKTRLMATNVTATTNSAIIKEVSTGLGMNEGIKDLSFRINKIFKNANKVRSNMIARSETIRYNTASSEQVYIDSGIVSKKVWQVNGNPCPRCMMMQGKEANLGSVYIKKGDRDPEGYLIDYDDIEGPPLHPMCECELVPRFGSAKGNFDKIAKIITKEIKQGQNKINYTRKLKELDDTLDKLNKIKIENEVEVEAHKKEKDKLKRLRKKLIDDYNKQIDEKQSAV